MEYKIDENDINFCLFDHLKVQEINKFEKYKDYGQDDIKAILEGVLKFAQNSIAPLNTISDQKGCEFKDGKVKCPEGFKEVYKASAELGLIAIDIPHTYGGQAMPLTVSTVIGEFLSGSSVAFTMYLGLTRGASHLIEAFGEESLAQKFCPKMYNGTWGGTMCLTEPNAGSAVGDLKTSAKKNADGTYNIKGNKIFISSGDHDLTDNIIHLVLARIEGDPAGTRGISLFAVPKIWVNEDGSLGEPNDVTTMNIEHKMGIKGSATAALAFGDNGNCKGFLVGEAGRGMPYMFQMMNEARLACGMQGMSVAGNAYEHALNYAKERTQGGNTAIVEYPDVKRMLITQKAYVEGMRALLYQTAVFMDIAEQSTDEKEKEYYEGQVALLTPICKSHCSDTAFKVTELAIQTYGGYGYCSEYPVEQLMRDVKISSIYEGTNGIQALDLIGRKLAQKQGQYFRDFYARIDKFCSENKEHQGLGKSVESVKKALDQLGQLTMKFAEWGMGGDREYPMLNACSYLTIMGEVIIGQLLVEQAIIAADKLNKILGLHDDYESEDDLIKNNNEAKYLDGKIQTARYFTAHLLPLVTARVKAVLSEDRSALQIKF